MFSYDSRVETKLKPAPGAAPCLYFMKSILRTRVKGDFVPDAVLPKDADNFCCFFCLRLVFYDALQLSLTNKFLQLGLYVILILKFVLRDGDDCFHGRKIMGNTTSEFAARFEILSW